MVGNMQFLEERYDTYIEKCFLEKLNDIEDRRYRESIKLSWLSDKMLYEDLTKKIEFEFTHYSLHDSSHSVSILQYIYMLLGKEIIDSFSVGDLWLLMEAAYSHDIGMSVNYEELIEIWKDRRKIEKIIEKISQCSDKEAMDIYNRIRDVVEETKDSKYEKSTDISPDWPLEFRRAITLINSEYIRQNHPERSKNKINDLISEREHLKIEERLYRVVGIVNHLHGTDFEEIEKLLDVLNTGFTTDKIHPRMIALLLRVGDVLDIRNNRFDYLNIKYLGHLPADSEVHFYKHKSVNNFLIDEETVKIHIDSDQLDVCSNSRAWLDYIELEMDHLIKYWKIYSHDLPPLKIKEIDLKVTYKGNEFIKSDVEETLKVNPKPLVELLSGKNFYNTNLIVFREYLQNAIDATKLRLAYKYYNDSDFLTLHNCNDFKEITIKDFADDDILKEYPIDIEIKKDAEDDNYIIFRIIDNGIGMDSQGIEALFNVGRGWKKRDTYNDLIEYLPDWMYPTGGFGIGTLSAFLVCDNVKYTTKSKSSPQYVVSINSPDKDGKVEKIVKEAFDDRIGTIVEFKIHFAKYFREIRKTISTFLDYDKNFLNENLIGTYKINPIDLDNRLLMVGYSLEYFVRNILVNEMFPIRIKVLTKSKYIHELKSNKLYDNFTKNYLLLDNHCNDTVIKYNTRNTKNTKFAYKGIFVFNGEKILEEEKFLAFLCKKLISSVDIYEPDVKKILEISRNNFLATYDLKKIIRKILEVITNDTIDKFSVLQEKKEITNYDNVIFEILPNLILYFYDKINHHNDFYDKYLNIVSDSKKLLYLPCSSIDDYLLVTKINSGIVAYCNDLLNIFYSIKDKPTELIGLDAYEEIEEKINKIVLNYNELKKDSKFKKYSNKSVIKFAIDLYRIKSKSSKEIFIWLKNKKGRLPNEYSEVRIDTKVNLLSLYQFELIKGKAIQIVTLDLLKNNYNNEEIQKKLNDKIFIIDDIRKLDGFYFYDDDRFKIIHYVYKEGILDECTIDYNTADINNVYKNYPNVAMISIEIEKVSKVDKNKVDLEKLYTDDPNKLTYSLNNEDCLDYEAIIIKHNPFDLKKDNAIIFNPLYDINLDNCINEVQIKEFVKQNDYFNKLSKFVYGMNKSKGYTLNEVIDTYIKLIFKLKK